MAMTRIFGVSLTVPDLGAALRFYGEGLGFAIEADATPCSAAYASVLGLPETRISSATMRLGAQRLELLAFDPPGRPYPSDSTSSDLWFQHCAIVVSDMAAAYAHLAPLVREAISDGGPQNLPAHTGGVSAWKFRDPFGHPLELLHFPQGAGDPAWHRPDPPLFQGIDHSAIAVSEAAASITFYATRFGLTVSSRTHNHGPEQSRLDGFAGADVDVVGLSPASAPPHLELLAYRTGTRRPRPNDWRNADLAVSRTIMVVDDAARALRLEHDPDGHAIVVRSRGL